MSTERQRQEAAAHEQARLQDSTVVRRFHFLCAADGFCFSAIAPSESGAWRVLNAERPGVQAVFTDCTYADHRY